MRVCTRSLGVQVGERLVHAEHLRLPHDRPTHRHPLPLTTGELRRLAVQELFEVKKFGGLLDLAAPLLGRHPTQLEREAHVLGNGLVGVQRVVLEHHRDVAVLGRHSGHVLAADFDGALVDVLQARQHPQGGTLARPGRPDQDHELAIGDVEAQRVDSELVRARVDARSVAVSDCSHEFSLLI